MARRLRVSAQFNPSDSSLLRSFFVICLFGPFSSKSMRSLRASALASCACDRRRAREGLGKSQSAPPREKTMALFFVLEAMPHDSLSRACETGKRPKSRGVKISGNRARRFRRFVLTRQARRFREGMHAPSPLSSPLSSPVSPAPPRP
jgi:hypothetical protein